MHHSSLSPKKLSLLLLALCIATLSMGTTSRAIHHEGPVAPTETIIRFDITTDTTWTLANSPYRVKEEIYVMPGVTLTIEPGVTVWVDPKLKIHVGNDNGGANLIAKGTPGQPITFTGYDPETGLHPRFKKIQLHPHSSSYFRYVEFAYGGTSGDVSTTLHFEGPGTHVVNRCTIRKSKLQGIIAQGDSLDVTVAGTLFEENGRRSVQADSGARVTITGSTIDTGNRIAIYLRDTEDTPATIIINDSNILSDGTQYAIYNELLGIVTINAENNWWGETDGPSQIGAGVDYTPWRTTEAPIVGITTPPVATFTVTPDPTVPQPPGTMYTFDASDCTDEEDYTSSLEVCWDWDNNGDCDTDYTYDKTEQHSFTPDAAVQTVRLVVRDTDGLTSETTQDIVLNSPPTAIFSVSPNPDIARLAGTVYTFDASSSWDQEDPQASLRVCWDWNNDGDCDTAYTYDKTEQHSFTNDDVPAQTVRLVVLDTGGAAGETTRTVQILTNQPPTVTFTFNQPIWDQVGARVDFDASGSQDDYDDTSDLLGAWDFQGNGDMDINYSDYETFKTASYTYTHLGRYWPTLYVKDTLGMVGTLRQPLDVIPPATGPLTLTIDNRRLESADKTVMVEMAPDTEGTLLLPEYGLVITHTPWLTLPHNGLPGAFLYQGFNLSARSAADGTQIEEISGTYTITISYDYDYFARVLHLPFENQIRLHHLDVSDTDAYWTPVMDFELDPANDQLVAMVSSFGDFALVIDMSRIYLPLVTRNY